MRRKLKYGGISEKKEKNNGKKETKMWIIIIGCGFLGLYVWDLD